MRSFAATFLNLVKAKMDTLQQNYDEKSNSLADFFTKSEDIVKVCLPFKLYARKLANFTSILVMRYASVDGSTQLLAF